MIEQKSKIFTDLIVWQKAHEFVLEVYNLISNFPKNKIYGLIFQFRRTAISILSNMAEGFKRRGFKNKLNFLNISQGSLEECRYYLIFADDLNYGSF